MDASSLKWNKFKKKQMTDFSPSTNIIWMLKVLIWRQQTPSTTRKNRFLKRYQWSGWCQSATGNVITLVSVTKHLRPVIFFIHIIQIYTLLEIFWHTNLHRIIFRLFLLTIQMHLWKVDKIRRLLGILVFVWTILPGVRILSIIFYHLSFFIMDLFMLCFYLL